jgi:hypothetical protein
MTKRQSARIRDFEDRIAADSEIRGFLGTQYLSIHPFADEPDILNDIGSSPYDCAAVDAYWKVEDDVAFVQVIAESYGAAQAVGRYVRWNPNTRYVNLIVVVATTTITRSVFEHELEMALRDGTIKRVLQAEDKLSQALLSVDTNKGDIP